MKGTFGLSATYYMAANRLLGVMYFLMHVWQYIEGDYGRSALYNDVCIGLAINFCGEKGRGAFSHQVAFHSGILGENRILALFQHISSAVLCVMFYFYIFIIVCAGVENSKYTSIYHNAFVNYISKQHNS